MGTIDDLIPVLKRLRMSGVMETLGLRQKLRIQHSKYRLEDQVE